MEQKITKPISELLAEDWAKKILEKYSPIDSLEKLLVIATKEYPVKECIEAPFCSLDFISKVGRSHLDGKLYIMYEGYDELDKMISLSHEIGHIASGHFHGYDSSLKQKEYEADLYASIILNKSIKELNELTKSISFLNYHPFLDEFKAHFSKRSKEFKKMLDSKGLTYFYKKK